MSQITGVPVRCLIRVSALFLAHFTSVKRRPAKKFIHKVPARSNPTAEDCPKQPLAGAFRLGEKNLQFFLSFYDVSQCEKSKEGKRRRIITDCYFY